MHFGTIADLKKEIGNDVPVIVFIKVNRNKNYLHYVPVVGYDEENFYIAESLKELTNANGLLYNCKISIIEFKKLWNTSDLNMPLYKNTYIKIT